MQTGVILIVHERYGEALVAAARALVGALELELVAAPLTASAEETRGRLARAAAAAEQGQGLLLITDLCGATPANACLRLLAEHPGSELVAGVNLPMLVKLSTCDRRRPARELAQELRRSAQRSVQLGSELLEKGEPSGD
jgi:PTS system mannose-specific IIA component